MDEGERLERCAPEEFGAFREGERREDEKRARRGKARNEQKETPASQQQVPDTGVYNRLNSGKRGTTLTRSGGSYGCVGAEYQGEVAP